MFTGLIQAVGVVVALDPPKGGQAGKGGNGGGGGEGGGARRLRLRTAWDHQPQPGDSVTVDGCCLTVVAAQPAVEPADGGRLLAFDAVAETLQRTTLGLLRQGDRVNLERSLRAEDLLGGHLVQGHVDGVGRVIEAGAGAGQGGAGAGGGGWRVRIGADPGVMEMVTPKGSIAVSGVSLTVASCGRDSFEVALIPETLARTNLSNLAPGALVNLETDILARTMIHWLKNWSGRDVGRTPNDER